MADIGLRVRSPSGYVETTVTTRLTKIIGSYQFPAYEAILSGGVYRAPAAANGGLVSSDFLGGTPFYYFTCEGQKSTYGMLVPSVTISGSNITWTWPDDVVNYHVKMEKFLNQPDPPATIGAITLHYGVYS